MRGKTSHLIYWRREKDGMFSYSSAVQGVDSVTSLGWNEVRVSSLHWILSIREKVQDGLWAQNAHHTLQLCGIYITLIHALTHPEWFRLSHTPRAGKAHGVFTRAGRAWSCMSLMLAYYSKIVRSTLIEERSAKLKSEINAKIFTHNHTQKRPFQEVENKMWLSDSKPLVTYCTHLNKPEINAEHWIPYVCVRVEIKSNELVRDFSIWLNATQ